MKIFIFSFSVVLFSSQCISLYAQTPSAAVTAFYKFDQEHSQVFNRRNIDARKRWFPDSLYRLFLNELRREKEYLNQNPSDKPHFGDGLPFRPLDETCAMKGKAYHYGYTVGQQSMRGSAATVPVRFTYPKGCRMPATEYNVRLIRIKNMWFINNIEYPDGTDLVSDLRRTEY